MYSVSYYCLYLVYKNEFGNSSHTGPNINTYLCPQLFTTNCDPTDFAPIVAFLATKLPATTEESRSLILHCTHLLFLDIEFCLQPTLDYLRQLRMENLSSPSSFNAHLLNTRANKLREKIGFVRSIGFSQEEAERACVRLPAMFGYILIITCGQSSSIWWIRWKGVEELKKFP